MKKSRYYYNDIYLPDYCRSNNFNLKSITKRIGEFKQNKKYENYTEQQIIDMVVESYCSTIKYMYKGKTLNQYCKENNINIATIQSRIKRLKKRNTSLSNDDLVSLAMDNFKNQNLKYFYKGITLRQYCKLHTEMNYENIVRYITDEKKNNTRLTDEQLIEQYLKKCIINDSIKKYCEDNDLNIKNVRHYINKYKKNVFESSTREFIESIMSQYEPFKPKYLYKGLSLSEYCNQNNLSYSSIRKYIKRKLEEDETESIDEVIEEAIKTIKRSGIKYYYKGIPLQEYADQNGLNANSIRGVILKKQLKSNKPLQELIDECVESYEKFFIKYYYKGQSLRKFCEENGYSYTAIHRRIKNLESKENLLNTDQIVEKAVKAYEVRLQFNLTNEIFNKLRTEKINNISEIKDICVFFKIDFDNLNDLLDMNFSYVQAINIIWYFWDEKTNDDYKKITYKKLKEILLLINDLKQSNVDIEKYDLYNLVGMYKCGLYDARNEILLRQKKHIYKILYSICKSYGIKVNNSNLEEFENEIKYYLLKAINDTNSNIKGQIIVYIDRCMKGNFKKYLKQYIQQKCLSLDDAMFLSNKRTRQEKPKIDYITSSSDLFRDRRKALFSPFLMKLLLTLAEEDLMFIILKYQENYSNDYLANYFDLTLDEVKEKETQILSYLRNNEEIKTLIKRK